MALEHRLRNVGKTLAATIAILCLLAVLVLFGTTYLAGEFPNPIYVGALLVPVVLYVFSPELARLRMRLR